MSFNHNDLYNRRPPTPEDAEVYIGDGTRLTVEYVDSLDITFHSPTGDVQVTLESVSLLPQLKVHLLSIHTIQAKEPIFLGSKGTHLLGGRHVFLRDRAGSGLNATRHPFPPAPVFSPIFVRRHCQLEHAL